MEVEFKTLREYGVDEFCEKKSRFIGYACPVKTEDEAIKFIAEIKSKHWDAKHNVYAYCIRENGIIRFSDDGEPQGTAGMPVLSVIQKEGLTDCVVVVTRYFGGILLGGGGLVRAYSHASKLALAAAGIVTKKTWSVYKLSADYTFYAKIESIIRDLGGVIISTDFSENVYIEYRFCDKSEDKFNEKLADLTNGRVKPEFIEKIISD